MTQKWNEIPSLDDLLKSITNEGKCGDLINGVWKDIVKSFTLLSPFDAHLHLRDGEMLKQVTPLSGETFAGGVIMPNLQPPVESVQQVLEYKKRIEEAMGEYNFTPNMTVNFKDYTPKDLEMLNDYIIGIKMYPKGQTTNSESGVNGAEIDSFRPTLEAMQDLQIPLLVHWEIVDGGDEVDILDKERCFAPVYERLAQEFPDLKIIMEHISTKELVELVKNSNYNNLYATATLHHLLTIHNHILEWGTKTHNMCMPVPKLYDDRKALLTEVLRWNPKIMFGSDSAPHPQTTKESANGCCGCFTAPLALQALIQTFEYFWELPKLQDFISGNAQKIYGDRLSLPKKEVIFQRKPFIIPTSYGKEVNTVVPFMAGKTLEWSVRETV